MDERYGLDEYEYSRVMSEANDYIRLMAVYGITVELLAYNKETATAEFRTTRKIKHLTEVETLFRVI
jgi:hypothetical protein